MSILFPKISWREHECRNPQDNVEGMNVGSYLTMETNADIVFLAGAEGSRKTVQWAVGGLAGVVLAFLCVFIGSPSHA